MYNGFTLNYMWQDVSNRFLSFLLCSFLQIMNVKNVVFAATPNKTLQRKTYYYFGMKCDRSKDLNDFPQLRKLQFNGNIEPIALKRDILLNMQDVR